MTEPRRPIGAFILSVFGGFLIILEGIVVVLLGDILGDLGAGPLAAEVVGLGVLTAVLGLAVFFLAVGILLAPEHHSGYGIAVLVLSLISFLVGGGFYLGGIFGCAGGVLAIYFQEVPPLPLPSRRTAPTNVPHTDRTCSSCGKLFSGTAKECPFCHASA
jgi:hypothetical protein